MTEYEVDGPRRWFTWLPVTNTYEVSGSFASVRFTLAGAGLLPLGASSDPRTEITATVANTGKISCRSARRIARLGAFSARLAAFFGFDFCTGLEPRQSFFDVVFACDGTQVASRSSPKILCNFANWALLKLVRVPCFANLASMLERNERSHSFTSSRSNRERMRACISVVRVAENGMRLTPRASRMVNSQCRSTAKSHTFHRRKGQGVWDHLDHH